MTATITAEVVDGALRLEEPLDLPNGRVQITVSPLDEETDAGLMIVLTPAEREAAEERIRKASEHLPSHPEERLRQLDEALAGLDEVTRNLPEDWWTDFEASVRGNRLNFRQRF